MRKLTPLAFLMLAGACAAPEPSIVPAAPAESASIATQTPGTVSYAEDLLAYLGRLRAMNENALNAEAARMKRDASDVARVKAALAMTLSAQADEGDILERVEPVAKKAAADRDVRSMAAFVQATALERRRLRQRANVAAGELREERRAAETQKQRAEQLQQKLDALTELEKSLAQRETAPR